MVSEFLFFLCVCCLFVACSLFTFWIRAEPLIYINYIIIIYYCIFRSEGRGGGNFLEISVM